MNDSFIFYRSFYEAIEDFQPEEFKEAMMALMKYALDGEESEVSGYVKTFYKLVKPQIDANNSRRTNGSKGGAPAGNKNAKKQPENNSKTTKQPTVDFENNQKQPNDNVNDNVNVNVNVNVNDNDNVNANENDNANVNDNKNILANARELFERLWRLYPNKKGKGQVSDTQKKRLLAIGEPELVKAIERYSSELQKDAGWRKPQNGSTFFNSGYVDYLDDNFVPSEDKPKSTGNAYLDAINNRMDVVDEWLRKRQEAHDDG